MSKEKLSKKLKGKLKISELAQGEIVAHLIAWDPGIRTTYDVLTKALKDAGLDPDAAKEIEPRQAFSRACKQLGTDRVIDVVTEDRDKVTFQFTAKTFKEEEWTFEKETNLELDKGTGVVTCEIKELRKLAQQEINRAIVDRSTGDITNVVIKLFDSHAEIWPWHNGVYLVMAEYLEFTDRVEQMLNAVGGHLKRAPIPSGTQHSTNVVKESMAKGLSRIIDDHRSAVSSFTNTTSFKSIEAQSVKIKESRVKVMAYANHLKEKAQELLDELDKEKKRIGKHLLKISRVSVDNGTAKQETEDDED